MRRGPPAWAATLGRRHGPTLGVSGPELLSGDALYSVGTRLFRMGATWSLHALGWTELTLRCSEGPGEGIMRLLILGTALSVGGGAPRLVGIAIGPRGVEGRGLDFLLKESYRAVLWISCHRDGHGGSVS